MLSEIASSLNHYYLKPPSYLNRPKKNLVLNQKNNNENDQINYQYPPNSENLTPNNNNFNYLNNKNIRSQKISTLKKQNQIMSNNRLGPNFTFKAGDIFTPSSLKNKININNIYKGDNYIKRNINTKLRPKSATKGRVSINNYNIINKKSLNNFKFMDDDYDINSNMNKFENLINIIDKNGFQKFQDEINEKKILISQLQNSIAILKNKISLSRNNINNRIHKEIKNQIKYENKLMVSSRYKNVGKTADNFKDEIDIIKNKIAFLNDETMEIKKTSIKEKNELDEINEEIKKGNKAISDRQKQIENILAATQLLKKHIVSTKQKIGKIKNIKQNYIDKLNYIEYNI